MKTPPDNPEFIRFTSAMRDIVKVSKAELNRRMESGKRTANAAASLDSGASSSKDDHQKAAS